VNTFNSGPANILHIYLNTLYEPLQDVRVRQAIQHSIDPRGLRALFDDWNPIAQSIFLPWMLGFDTNLKGWKPQDYAKAKNFLAESGYKDGFDLNVAPDSRDENALVGAALGPMIAKTGIDARVSITQVTEWSTVTSDREQTSLHVYPLTLGYRAESIDFFDFWFRAKFRRLRSSMEIPFLHGTFDPRVRQRGPPDFGFLGKISREPDETERAKLYKEAATYVIDEALMVLPTYFTRTAAMRSRVANWDKGPVWPGNGNYNAYRTTVA
ncbi:MAG: ABC transporter substrate-binding protein, partial [Nitrososphaerales archaeon]